MVVAMFQDCVSHGELQSNNVDSQTQPTQQKMLKVTLSRLLAVALRMNLTLHLLLFAQSM